MGKACVWVPIEARRGIGGTDACDLSDVGARNLSLVLSPVPLNHF